MANDLTKVKNIILDIEGTTTSISFVKDILFRYVTDNCEKYLHDHINDKQCRKDIEALTQLSKQDVEQNVTGAVLIPENCDNETLIHFVIENIKWQMVLDRKTTALKDFQGHMWLDAFTSGTLYGHIYDDVIPSLLYWTNLGKKIYIYSSGSIEAQKLIFANTKQGNVLEYFTGFFDTTIGSKIESSSYKKICQELDCIPSTILYLTDVTKEAYAAQEAGIITIVVLRPGNVPLTAEESEHFQCINSFKEIFFRI